MCEEQQYAEIVRRFADPSGEFFRHFRNVMNKYRPTLSDDSIIELYDETFIAAKKNLMAGRVRENTSWNSYLICIGLNLATHEFREFGKYRPIGGNIAVSEKDDDYIPVDYSSALADTPDETVADYDSVEVQTVLAQTLEFMKEKCRNILEWTLYGKQSSEEIAIKLNSTARSIITQRNRCKKQLVDMLKAKLISLGYKIEENGED